MIYDSPEAWAADIPNWTCQGCGAQVDVLSPHWRWSGGVWEHRCAGARDTYRPAVRFSVRLDPSTTPAAPASPQDRAQKARAIDSVTGEELRPVEASRPAPAGDPFRAVVEPGMTGFIQVEDPDSAPPGYCPECQQRSLAATMLGIRCTNPACGYVLGLPVEVTLRLEGANPAAQERFFQELCREFGLRPVRRAGHDLPGSGPAEEE